MAQQYRDYSPNSARTAARIESPDGFRQSLHIPFQGACDRECALIQGARLGTPLPSSDPSAIPSLCIAMICSDSRGLQTRTALVVLRPAHFRRTVGFRVRPLPLAQHFVEETVPCYSATRSAICVVESRLRSVASDRLGRRRRKHWSCEHCSRRQWKRSRSKHRSWVQLF